MDIEKICNLIEKAEESSFDKIEIQIQDFKLCLERNCGGAPIREAYEMSNTRATQKNIAAPAEETQTVNPDDVIATPISGVFYAAKEPGAEPFVKEGCDIKKGETVCIIEAMKMMNEISAPKTGVIQRVLLPDGQPVLENDSLFIYAREK
ncbi:MAG: biotin/lipoyl-containing protein [Christensenellales bacterium]